ncbi:MAG TPA: AAA family ATPase [Candidatus Limnocylindria bacterium]|jgi:class 3 adenylate cyclase/tetratricopeptide (TPR) repeat protein
MREERRLVTIVIADVVASTARGEAMDAEELRALLSRYYGIAREAVLAHGGTIEKFIGDQVFAIFGLPTAHGDDAARALSFALELRDRVAADPRIGVRLPIRIGVASGEVVAVRDPQAADFIVTGDAANVAARLQADATPGTIVVTERAARATGDRFAFGPRGSIRAKGKAEPLAVHTLLGASEPRPLRIPLFGRRSELAQLELAARRSLIERRPSLVTVIAPAGVGKTRLLEEFLARLPQSVPDATVATAQCLPYGQRLTYWPLRQMLFGLASIPEVARSAEIRERLTSWLVELQVDEPERIAVQLAATVGAADADQPERHAMRAAWRAFVDALARREPLVLVFEDLQWSSDSLLDLLDGLLRARPDTPLLVVATTRPELLERRTGWAVGQHNQVALELEPLADAEIAAIVDHALPQVGPAIRERIIERAEGNPFFAVELARSVLEAGPETEATTQVLAKLPDTVQATVLARLDLLPPVERRILQLGAVLGRTVRADGLVALDPKLGDQIQDACARLVGRDLLRPLGVGRFVFRHIIIRDVAYATLTRLERSRLHATAAAWIESVGSGREEAFAELIAYHYRESVSLHAEDDDERRQFRDLAVRWLTRAAHTAVGAGAAAEASRHLRAAIEIAPSSDQPELYELLGDAKVSPGYRAEDPTAYVESLRLCRELGRPPSMQLRVIAKLLETRARWSLTSTAEELDELRSAGDALLARVDDEEVRARFLIVSGFDPWLTMASSHNEHAAATERRMREGMAIAARRGRADLLSLALDGLQARAQGRGDTIAVEALNLERVALGERIDLFERVDAHAQLAANAFTVGRLDDALARYEAGLAEAPIDRVPGLAIRLLYGRTYVLALLGRWDDAIADADRCAQIGQEAGLAPSYSAMRAFVPAVEIAAARADPELRQRFEALLLASLPERGSSMRGWIDALSRQDAEKLAAMVHGTFGQYHRDAMVTERTLGACCDAGVRLDLDAAAAIALFAERHGYAPREAQARRAIGIALGDVAQLTRALELFERSGMVPSAARARCERAVVTHDAAELARGRATLERLGDRRQLDRFARLAGAAT